MFRFGHRGHKNCVLRAFLHSRLSTRPHRAQNS